MSEAPSYWPAPQGELVPAKDVSFFVIDQGQGFPVVFLHGGGPGCHGWSDFGPVIALISPERRCIAVDLLQYGKSDKPVIHGPVWDFHAERLGYLIDSMELGPVDLVCNSWGGSVGLCLAGRRPELVASLVVTGSMPVLHGALSPLPEGLSTGGAGPGRGRRVREWYYGGDGPSKEKMRQLMAEVEWYDASRIPEATVAARYEMSLDPEERRLGMTPRDRGQQQDLSDLLVSLQAPVLFLWGREDAFLPLDYPLMLANMVPKGHFHVMAHAAHHLQEEQPEAYAAIVRAFLDNEGRRI